MQIDGLFLLEKVATLAKKRKKVMKKNIFIIMCMLSGIDSFAMNPFVSHPFVDHNGNVSAKATDYEQKMRLEAKPAKVEKQASTKVLSKKLDDGRVLKFDGKNVIVNDDVKFVIRGGKGVRLQLINDIFLGRTSREYKKADLDTLNQRLKCLFIELTIGFDGKTNLLRVPVCNYESTNKQIIGYIKTYEPEFVIDKPYKIGDHDVSINADIQVVVDDVAYNIPKNNCDRITALAVALKSGGTFDWIDLCTCLKLEKPYDKTYRYKWIQMLRDCIMNSPLKINSSSGSDVYRLFVG